MKRYGPDVTRLVGVSNGIVVVLRFLKIPSAENATATPKPINTKPVTRMTHASSGECDYSNRHNPLQSQHRRGI